MGGWDCRYPRDPEISAVPRGNDRMMEGQVGLARRWTEREGRDRVRASRGLACGDYGSRPEYGRPAVQVSREEVRLSNRSGVTRKEELFFVKCSG